MATTAPLIESPPVDPKQPSSSHLPTLGRDRAFWGMTVTQFLGAFNDNLFKQLVLLFCIDVKFHTAQDYQSWAQAIFAIPFVLFSGMAGWLADRYSKRTIVVLAKVAEIVIMFLGMLVFLYGPNVPYQTLMLLFVVLGCMSLQSAFFGPPKYGILPELFRDSDLPAANGIFQMTTFVAIIMGGALGGIGKQYLGNQLWMMSACCVLLAIVGTGTSFLVRKTPIAKPGLKFELSTMVMHHTVYRLLKKDRMLVKVMGVLTLFWFMGAVMQLAANELGKLRLGLSDGRTSILMSGVALGIAIGCAAAAKLSHHRINFKLVTVGAWGIFVSMVLTTVLAWSAPTPDLSHLAQEIPTTPESAAVSELEGSLQAVSARLEDEESIGQMLFVASWREWAVRFALALAGMAGGLLAIPLQVVLQTRPPDELKGRVIGSMNLITWVGVLCSAGFFGVSSLILEQYKLAKGIEHQPVEFVFAALAVIILPVALLYRPREAT
jgi:acyl-[acyl-carrier-protein]-phospholipid O-acyltransferase/long-chain-fatty-acid--[acyl-carrier-protein] ligase